MPNSLLIGLSRQVAMERQFDVVANNIANLNTTGFKASTEVFSEFLGSNARENTFAATDSQVHFVLDRSAFRDFGQGAIQQTSNPLDIAIAGDAFIAVQAAGGERYTRNGALQINSAGELVTSDGTKVAGDAGPIVFQPTDRNVSISPDGRVTVIEGLNTTEVLRGRIKLASFAQPQQLQNEGGNLYSAPAGVQAQPATNSRIIQGAIEGSNVNAVLEMTRMVEINRTYSMIAALMQTQDDQHKSSIDKLAQVPN
jgi:flagellar basal-body rod protein FlgF